MSGAAGEERWPGWVYADGEEPDYRWSFANERTYLAWIRTALALVAAGVALEALGGTELGAARTLVAILLLLAGLAIACLAWPRWALAERAMRLRGPLPATRLSLALAVVVGVVTIALLLVVFR